MNINGNQEENPLENITKEVGNKAAKAGKQGAKALAKKAGKMAGKALLSAAKKGMAVAMKAIASALAPLIPYILLGIVILFVIVAGYYVLFETRGAESHYSLNQEDENITKMNDKGYFSTSKMSGKNKAILEFYNYFGTRAYRQIVGNDNTKLEKPEDTKIKDFYNQEKLFSINPNFLFVLDEYVFKGQFKYPEQFIQPVNYDPKELKLEQLVNDKYEVTAESMKYDEKTGLKTKEKEKSVHDYGIGSIFKYKKDEILNTVEGNYYAAEVVRGEHVEVVPINEPYREVMHDYPKEIHLIDKAITFALDVQLAYEKVKTPLEGLKDGRTKDPKTNLSKVYYKTQIIYDKDGQPVGKVDLYKYRKGYVYETKPVPTPENNIENKYGTKYIKDYMFFFNAWVPKSVMTEFNFDERVGSILDTDLDVGSQLDSENFRRSMQYFDIVSKYAEDYGVDPYIIIAKMAQESGGNPNPSNGQGLMQISYTSNYRAISAKNVRTGQNETFAVANQSDREDPEKAIRWAVMYFATKLDKFDGDSLKALQAYNVDVSGYIQKHYPEAWQTTDWMNYREEARLYYGQKEGYGETRSASYDCAPNLQKSSGKVYGDVCYVEHVLRYYGGEAMSGLEEHDTDKSNGVVDFFNKLFNIKQKKYDDNEVRSKFTHNMGNREIDMTIKSVTTFSQKVLFSEVGNTEELEFWDDAFSTTNGNLSRDQFAKMVPGADGYISPVALDTIRISSGFGSRIDPVTHKKGAFHKGVDVPLPIGTPVYAISNGTVEAAGKASGYGQWVVIRLDDGAKTVYGHISKWAVKAGDKVSQGQIVAYSGNEGKSTGPHLHFEYHLNGKPTDPYSIVVRNEEKNSLPPEP
ncbi:M23 family metallopeptidase [Paenibacillus polymyxa]|uniref:M23 family metallopeptidase n=1 Tax=Paenibacillus polymyxa TaxID=1406 RepID=UPI0001E6CD5F|nr:M23 family metallopeptidase [Paenibacillus polymyxa]WPQ59611.1 M23 family metallopeptidase [Paenibacillus polymyxa]